MSANIPRRKEDLTEKERRFFDQIMADLPEIESYHRIRHVCFRHRVPGDFTQEEFDNVGYVLTSLGWIWYQLGKIGDVHWSYILDPET
jgi:hypothetical protein